MSEKKSKYNGRRRSLSREGRMRISMKKKKGEEGGRRKEKKREGEEKGSEKEGRRGLESDW